MRLSIKGNTLLLLGILLFALPFLIHSQITLCDGVRGPNLYTNFNNGTFGSGTNQNGTSLGVSTSYNYTGISCSSPNDGYYSIANSTDCTGSGGSIFNAWYIIGDHTGATNLILGNPPPAPGSNAGYMMVINADYMPNVVITDSIRNLCPNVVYEFNAWVRKLIVPINYIQPNITFMINGVDYYSTGDITDTTWKNVGFKFTTPLNQTAINVAIRNNAPGGNGNDWVLDDISINTCNPKILIGADSIITVCEGDAVTLQDTIISPTGTPFSFYKWQKSTDGGITWIDETGVLKEVKTPANYIAVFTTFIAKLSMNNYIYRLISSTDSTVLIQNNICSFSAHKITKLIVNPLPIIYVPADTICSGSSTTLTAIGATSYIWSPAIGLSATTGNTVTANPTTTTTYTVCGSFSSGCSACTNVIVTVNPTPVIVVPNANICLGLSVALTATGAGNYIWSPANGLSATTGATVNANPITTTTYTIIGTNSQGCSSSSTVVVTVDPPCKPTVSVTGIIICNGGCGTITSTVTGGLPPYA
ncbi:MAG: hypothetical protein H0W84_11190, partial [Bacteroidetes bacterium]|nr:hypothetical protein [Bacteroidota bacterium]